MLNKSPFQIPFYSPPKNIDFSGGPILNELRLKANKKKTIGEYDIRK